MPVTEIYIPTRLTTISEVKQIVGSLGNVTADSQSICVRVWNFDLLEVATKLASILELRG